jgi:hypothetical protein
MTMPSPCISRVASLGFGSALPRLLARAGGRGFFMVGRV